MRTTPLQTCSGTLAQYAKKWKLKLNPTKTESVLLLKRCSDKAFPKKQIVIEGHRVPWSNKAKYLGKR